MKCKRGRWHFGVSGHNDVGLNWGSDQRQATRSGMPLAQCRIGPERMPCQIGYVRHRLGVAFAATRTHPTRIKISRSTAPARQSPDKSANPRGRLPALSGELEWPRDRCAAIASRKSRRKTRPSPPHRRYLSAAHKGSRRFRLRSRNSLDRSSRRASTGPRPGGADLVVTIDDWTGTHGYSDHPRRAWRWNLIPEFCRQPETAARARANP